MRLVGIGSGGRKVVFSTCPRPPHVPQKTYLAATKQQESTQPVVVNVDWEHVAEGHILPAEITSALSYGAFARLQAGIEGLIHATEMPLEAWQTPCDILTEGQQVRAFCTSTRRTSEWD